MALLRQPAEIPPYSFRLLLRRSGDHGARYVAGTEIPPYSFRLLLRQSGDHGASTRRVEIYSMSK